jgi:hypothetical protein
MPAQPLPLFPLRAVLYPGVMLALRIFETRYIDLVRYCMRSEQRFGIVAIMDGLEVGDAETYRVGTLARIVDWTTTRDGLLGLQVLGEDRFRFGSTSRAADGLYLAHDVTLLSEAIENPGPEWARDLLARLHRSDDGPPATDIASLDDGNRVCWNLALQLPLVLEDRQALLELEPGEARFEWLRAKAAELVDDFDEE